MRRGTIPATWRSVHAGRTRRSPGSSYLLVLGTVSVIFILGFAYIHAVIDEAYQSRFQGHGHVAYELAEAGVARALLEFSRFVSAPLVSDKGEVNEPLTRFYDITDAPRFQQTWTVNDLVKGGSVTVKADLENVKETPMGGFLVDREVPPRLEQYRREVLEEAMPEPGAEGAGEGGETPPPSPLAAKPKKKSAYAYAKKLGGWQGFLRIRSTGTYLGKTRELVVIREIKVYDLSPPSPDYTLFVSGEKTEYLREGTFVLENGMKDLVVIAQGLIDDMARLAPYLRGRMENMIAIVRDFVTKVKFTKPQDKDMEEVFKSYQIAGRVRTNGTLRVWLPFFALDDVINYFVSNSFYEKPEVGYPFCENLLHDPYMSWATKLEGDVKKHYYEMMPYVITDQKPIPKMEQYTRWSTFPNYIKQYPSEREPENLAKIAENVEKYASQILPAGTRFTGTREAPYRLNGITFVRGAATIGGVFVGKGMIVTDGTVTLAGNVNLADKHSMLSIVILKGSFSLGGKTEAKLRAALYARDSITGGNAIEIQGNLVVKNLNRQDGENGKLLMPASVVIKYDKRIRPILGSNLSVAVSRADYRRFETSAAIEE